MLTKTLTLLLFGGGTLSIMGQNITVFDAAPNATSTSVSGINDQGETTGTFTEAGLFQFVNSLRRDVHEPDSTCCLHSDRFRFCLFKQPT
jgi:hypothetical protein